MEKFGIGFRVHSGWAAAVAVSGSPRKPKVLSRLRIEIADVALAGSKQPYHAAVRLNPEEAGIGIACCHESSLALASDAVRALSAELKQAGFAVTGAGILYAAGRPLPELAAILRSHALLHTAEGEFFRDVLARASAECGLPVTRVKEREIWEQSAVAVGMPVEELERRVGELGKALGPPWTQDQKLAALAGWLVLETGE